MHQHARGFEWKIYTLRTYGDEWNFLGATEPQHNNATHTLRLHMILYAMFTKKRAAMQTYLLVGFISNTARDTGIELLNIIIIAMFRFHIL